MKVGILTPEEFLAEQRAARKRDGANAESGGAAIQRNLLDVVFGIDVFHWQGDLNWLRILERGLSLLGIIGHGGAVSQRQEVTRTLGTPGTPGGPRPGGSCGSRTTSS